MPRIARVPSCHPDRRHYAHGLCAPCWGREYDRREASRPASCHPDRPVTAKGLCHKCYSGQRNRADCHPDRPRVAKGLCWACYQKGWAERHPESVRRTSRAHELRRKFGITVLHYEAMLAAQKGACAICGNKRGARRLAVDHDHLTGEVRGLLCERCNQGIGFLGDDPERLMAAAKYLQKTRLRVLA